MIFLSKKKFKEVVADRVREEQDRLNLVEYYHHLQDEILKLNDEIYKLQEKIHLLEYKVDSHYFPDLSYTLKPSDTFSAKVTDECGPYTTSYLNSLKKKDD